MGSPTHGLRLWEGGSPGISLEVGVSAYHGGSYGNVNLTISHGKTQVVGLTVGRW